MSNTIKTDEQKETTTTTRHPQFHPTSKRMEHLGHVCDALGIVFRDIVLVDFEPEPVNAYQYVIEVVGGLTFNSLKALDGLNHVNNHIIHVEKITVFKNILELNVIVKDNQREGEA